MTTAFEFMEELGVETQIEKEQLWNEIIRSDVNPSHSLSVVSLFEIPESQRDDDEVWAIKISVPGRWKKYVTFPNKDECIKMSRQINSVFFISNPAYKKAIKEIEKQEETFDFGDEDDDGFDFDEEPTDDFDWDDSPEEPYKTAEDYFDL